MAVYEYDAFLSFRGADTRRGFTGHLYSALVHKGIRTFFDDEELRSGELITPALHTAIRRSRIAIIIFSKTYAFSSFCLDELDTIFKSFKEKDRLVLPIFYEVDPCDVRHQLNSYREGLAIQEERFKLEKDKIKDWRKALREVANLSGFHFKQGDPYEYEFIGRILETVSSKINHAPLHVAKYPVGLESRAHKVNSLLDIESGDVVHMVAIHGIGGIGKTTVARVVFNSNAIHFDGACFLSNVRETSLRFGLVHIQEMLLSALVGGKDINIIDVNQGMSIIKQRLHRKKVLMVLDDVDKLEQLQAMAGATNWFGSGSRVIITTRDTSLLAIHDIKIRYEVEELNKEEACELFSWNAFKTTEVDQSYVSILNRAVSYASGLPLALEVIGSTLYGKTRKEWEDALEWYERVPHKDIQKILELSFISLDDDEKIIFLDIACCFGGYKLAEVEDILCAHHGSSRKSSISTLIEKSLVKVDDGLVTLHELIQDMGREIVRRESLEEPGKRSRLWFFGDVVQVLEEDTGSSNIQILILDFPKDGPKGKVNWKGEAFKKMDNLKLLIIRNVHFSVDPTYLPKRLRVLKWWGYPSPSFPDDFCPKRLAILELPDSFLTTSKPVQMFECLTVLDFSDSDWITHISDVSGLPNLEKLSFKDCKNLIEIHESVGYLDKLKILDAVGCKELKTFRPIRLTSLEYINLSRCSVLESFPELLGKMENITELCIMSSPIKELPFSIGNLTRLRKLELQLCGKVQLPSSILMLSELGLLNVSRCEGLLLSKQDKGEEMMSMSSNTERLILSYCNISDEILPICLAWFNNVKDLNLSGNNFTFLHSCIKECRFLRNLILDDCRLLREIRGIPCKLETFSAKGCTSLKDLDLTDLPAFTDIRELILDGCVQLQEIRGVLPNLEHFSAKNCTSLTSWSTSMLLNQKTVEAGNKMFSLPGTKVPEWFAHHSRGGSIPFWLRGKFPFISVCLVIGLVNDQPITVKFSPTVLINGNKQVLASRKVYEFRIATDHIFLFDLQMLKFDDNVDIFSENEWVRVDVSYADHITYGEVPIKQVLKQSGIHVIKQTSGMEDILFSNPSNKKRKSDFLLTCESENRLLLKEKHRLVDVGVSETQFMQKQQHLPLSTLHVEHSRERLSSLPAEGMQNVNLDPNLIEDLHQRVKTSAMQPWKGHTMVSSSPLLTSTQPPPALAEKGEDVGEETTKRLPEDPVVNAEGHGGDDVKHRAVSFSEQESEESFSNTEDSDSDNPFDQVGKKLSDAGKQTTYSGESSGDASLRSIQGTIDTLELLMLKDLTKVSSDPAVQSQLDELLDLLSLSSYHKVTTEVKESLFEFKKKAFASFKEFQSTVESVDKLKNFEMQRARIQQETVAGKDQWKGIKNSKKKASLAIKAKNTRKKELEAEIATLRKQLALKERNLEQLVLNVKNEEATLSTYSTTCASLDEQARALLKEADDLVTANIGIEEGGEAANTKQNRLKSTWSTDLTCQFIMIKKMLGRYE